MRHVCRWTTNARKAALAFGVALSIITLESTGVPRECEIEYSELDSFSQNKLTSIMGSRQAGRGLGRAISGMVGQEVQEDRTAEDAEFCREVRKLLREQDRLERQQDREVQRQQLEELREMNRRRRGY